MRVISKSQGRKSKKGCSWGQYGRNRKAQSQAKTHLKELEKINYE